MSDYEKIIQLIDLFERLAWVAVNKTKYLEDNRVEYSNEENSKYMNKKFNVKSELSNGSYIYIYSTKEAEMFEDLCILLKYIRSVYVYHTNKNKFNMKK